MDQHFYHTSEFAHKASVSVRTLRYYDKVGLLSPSAYTESGYRLYTDTDFVRLQQILALKFLGFSLQEIQQCILVGPMILQESLALQKAMMREKQAQLNSIIEAITRTQRLLETNTHDWESIIQVIQVISMTQNNEWHEKYFTPEQMQQMDALREKHYTPEQRQKLAEWGKNWSEEDQRVADQQWGKLFAELKRLTAEGQDPAGHDAQTLVQQWNDLVGQFTHGDSGIQTSLGSFVSEVQAIPAAERPYTMPITKEEGEFLKKAMEAQK